MHKIDASRRDLAGQFRDRPFGPHGTELQKILKILRWDPIDDRIIAVQPQRNGRWQLARSTGRKGSPIEIFEGPGYATPAEAQWAIFRSRWERHTGQPLELEGDTPLLAEGRMATNLSRRAILGYSDRFSVEAGGRIAFKVSAETSYRVAIERLRCGDEAGIGLKTTLVDTPVNRDYPGRRQAVACGSYVEIDDGKPFALKSFTLLAHVWPTLPLSGRRQVVMGGRGYALAIDGNGRLSLQIGAKTVAVGKALLERHWYVVAASFDAATGEGWIGQRPLLAYAAAGDTTAEARAMLDVPPVGEGFRIAAGFGDGATAEGYYNGKIDGPLVASRALLPAERAAFLADAEVPAFGADLVAEWDFSREISGTRVIDIGPGAHHGHTVNLPTRAMKGHDWDGSEYNWQHKPEHYGAIHFHDDDLYDCGWETDFTFEVPAGLRSGLYCAHLICGADEDYVPFVVRPPRGTVRAPLALLLPTASYWAYGNTHHHLEWREGENVRGVFTTVDATTLFLHEHPEFGCSLYDHHRDGSGVCYASRLRPVLNMRPRERLWQFPADTHITDWLEAKGIAYDVITEDDLEAEGEALLSGYRCVMTGTHPEYPSKRMLDAFAAFQNNGGRFIYLGGNGFYWRTSYHADLPGVIEMRRAEDGIRSWAAEGGEYYHGFTGELGGMWRRMGRAPQSVAGVGMTAQGFDLSTYYERTLASFDPRVAFAFEGIGKDERIGAFGLIGGGAAGWEIDRADERLGTPPHALVVAEATDFTASYHWMKEELTHTHSAITGETCPLVRCDMIFYETPGGGAVFSTSSIAWAGALAHNGYDNNVSRLTENVVRRFIDPTPF
ncbi:MAG: N,N-dimethylformamidase [Proteobacteria bacterium]|nr:N,N-dimethylformamidase [Pseudomonadota bacterium]